MQGDMSIIIGGITVPIMLANALRYLLILLIRPSLLQHYFQRITVTYVEFVALRITGECGMLFISRLKSRVFPAWHKTFLKNAIESDETGGTGDETEVCFFAVFLSVKYRWKTGINREAEIPYF